MEFLKVENLEIRNRMFNYPILLIQSTDIWASGRKGAGLRPISFKLTVQVLAKVWKFILFEMHI